MLIYSIAFLLFFSCFNSNKIDKKSSSDFLAYYNTFYMAEKYYNDALEIIQLNESEAEKIPTQALSLLDDAIENALVIEEKFYDTKYLDDAYYILGMSSYYKNNITSSEYYFNRIVNEYKNDEYYNKSLIMLGYLNLKMNKINELDKNLNQIENNLSVSYELYLYYLLLAEYSIFNEDIESEKKYYLLALDNLKSSNDKISIYYKLIRLAEVQEDYATAILYIDSIEILLDEINISDELMDKWIDYNRAINDFDVVLIRLSELLNQEQSPNKIIYYNLEISKTYIDMYEYRKAEDVLLLIIDDYIDNISMKTQLSEVYYLLGNIYLSFYLNFEKSQEYYQYSIDISKTSKYGKESQKNITSIANYNSLIDEIKYIKSDLVENQIEEIDSLSQNMSFDMPVIKNNSDYKGIDSLLFNAGQILYFDLGIRDSALYKFEDIIYNYPKSNFRYKSLLISDIEYPNSNWKNILDDEYLSSNNIYTESNLIDSLIDVTWDYMLISKEKAIDDFVEIHAKYNDEKSLYVLGYIFDDYFKDIDNAMFYYDMYLEKFQNGQYFTIINNRKSELEGMFEYNVKFIEQKLNCRIALDFFENNFRIDSSLFYMNLGASGVDRDLKSYCNNIAESIKLYIKNDSLYKMNYLNLDSVKVNLANILYKDLSFDSLAVPYYKDIISNSKITKNINESLAALSVIYGNGKWDSLLYASVQDSNSFTLLLNNSYRKHEFDFKVAIEQDKEDLNWFQNKYKQYFYLEKDDER